MFGVREIVFKLNQGEWDCQYPIELSKYMSSTEFNDVWDMIRNNWRKWRNAEHFALQRIDNTYKYMQLLIIFTGVCTLCISACVGQVHYKKVEREQHVLIASSKV
jgi:hypothetical protein